MRVPGVEVLDCVLARDEEERGGLAVGAVDVDGAVVEDVLVVGAGVVLHVVLHGHSHVAARLGDHLVAQRGYHFVRLRDRLRRRTLFGC